jgi:3-phosphoshikimate 1-carboxyvinyltransferase
MNGNCELLSNQVRASQASRLVSLQSNFETCPDLVPCLAVTCAFAEGESVLSGLSKLVYKESNRIQNTLNLLTLAGVLCDYRNDALIIKGLGIDFIPKTFRFNPDQDHRMAMAAGLFKLRNPKIQIESPEVVNKSFKNFWNILKLPV